MLRAGCNTFDQAPNSVLVEDGPEDSVYLKSIPSCELLTGPKAIKLAKTIGVHLQEELNWPAGQDLFNIIVSFLVSEGPIRFWNHEQVLYWWKHSLAKDCQEYLPIIKECQLIGTDLLDLDFEMLKECGASQQQCQQIISTITLSEFQHVDNFEPARYVFDVKTMTASSITLDEEARIGGIFHEHEINSCSCIIS